jgi:hypothetical protein
MTDTASRRSSKIFLDPIDGKTERVGPGFKKADKRPLWLTVVDPFNFSGILGGKGYTLEKFWEEPQPAYGGGELQPLKSGATQEQRAV